MKRRFRNLLSIGLAAVMLAGALPVSVLAEEAETEAVVSEETLPGETETVIPEETLPRETEGVMEETLPGETEAVVPEETLPDETEAPVPEETPAEETDAEPVLREAAVPVREGESGTNVHFTITDDGSGYNYTVTFTGTGVITQDWETIMGTDKCDRVYHIVIGKGITGIGESALADCLNVSEIQIPNTVTSIGRYAFRNWYNLESITIPGSVTEIVNSFMNSGISRVTIGNGVQRLGQYAFAGLNIEKIVIPGSVREIGPHAFRNCISLQHIVFSPGLERIENDAFYGCTSLTELIFPNTLTYLNGTSVRECSNLERLTIPASVKTIFASSFAIYVPNIYQIRFGGTEAQWAALNVSSVPEDTLLCNAAVFNDVLDTSQFYFRLVYWGADEGLIAGWSDGTFRPMNNCNRASIVTFLWRYAGSPRQDQSSSIFKVEQYMNVRNSITDLPDDDTFEHAIVWAEIRGIATGWDDGTFRPWNTCNRASIVTFLWRYAHKPAADGPNHVSFSDMTGNSDFDSAIWWAASYGIVTGYSDGTFRPWNTCNRLAVAAFLYRFAEYEAEYGD